MQVWTPGPYPRDDGEFAVEDNPGSDGKPFAVIHLSENGLTALVLQGVSDCDRLIKAAVRAKDMLLAREADRQLPVAIADHTAPIWAVHEPTEGEVAGPFTHREASRWAEVNALTFAGVLTVGRARTDVAATAGDDAGRAIVADLKQDLATFALGLTSPVPTRAEQVLPAGYSLPGAGTDAR